MTEERIDELIHQAGWHIKIDNHITTQYVKQLNRRNGVYRYFVTFKYAILETKMIKIVKGKTYRRGFNLSEKDAKLFEAKREYLILNQR